MKITKVFGSVTCAAILLTGLAREVKGDAWNKKTIITITEPLQVPKLLLEPGKYVFKLADSQSDRHIVQVFNADESRLLTTILAIPNYRLRPRGKTEFGFWETPAGQPRALRAWFYPGDNFGQEFAYPSSMSTQIATYSKESVQSYSDSETDLKTAKLDHAEFERTTEQTTERTTVEVVTQPAREETTVVIAQNTQPAPTPEPEPAPAPAAQVTTTETEVSRTSIEQADQAPATLPQTAGNYPLIAFIGLLSLGSFVAMSRHSHRAKR